MHYIAVGVLLSTIAAAAQAPSLEFEVASIKRNTTNTFASVPRSNPASGQFVVSNAELRTVILRGYPVDTTPAQVEGLPQWAQSERYDVIARGKPGATRDEQQRMWKALLSDRMKLAAHYEMRERDGYHLVFARADKRLGPQFQPSSVDCTKPPPPATLDGSDDEKSLEAAATANCSILLMETPTARTASTGATTMANLVRVMSGFTGRTVIDRTGLSGSYAMKLQFASEGTRLFLGGVAAPTDEVPSLLTAVQEQLGLKLEPAMVQAHILVIDHIERPSEN